MKIKNNTANPKTWTGQEIQPGAYYTLSASEILKWQSDDAVITDVGNGNLIVNDGVNDLLAATGLKMLLGNIVEISKNAEPQPFALPAYRTKINATQNTIQIQSGQNQTIDFLITEERYVSGGALIVKNAEFGDYITAEVKDIDGVIPAPYRPALCENWPTVSRYIEKAFIKMMNGAFSTHEINTYPLNAKLTAGLYLSLTYHAVNTGQTREIAVNYYLTKKL